MEQMYKEATKRALRFNTTRGGLSAEQLWNLPLAELDALVISYEEAAATGKRKSYLTSTETAEDKELALRKDIALDILKTRIADADAAKVAADRKAWKNRIRLLIENKKDQELENKSLDELEKLLAEQE